MKTQVYSSSPERKLTLLISFLVMLFCSLCSTTLYAQDQEAYVETDAPDYAPGSTVIIAGEYWTPGEVVYLKVTHLLPLPVPDATGVTPNPYDAWTVIADANGEVHTTWYVNEFEAGAQLQLEAYTDSGYDYRTFFTDGQRSLSSVAVGSQTGVVRYGQSGNATYGIVVNTTATGGGTANLNNINLSVIGLPAGVTGSFSPASLNASNSNQSPTSTLTVSVPNNINAGSYAFTVRASVTQGSNTTLVENTSALLVSKAASVTTVTITGAPFTYTGSAITPASVAVTGAGGLSLTPDPVYTDNINAGIATASYTYAGDANHEGSSDSKSFTIGKATSTTVVAITGAPFTYTGSAITPASVAVTGAGGLSLTPDPVYTDNINAGTATASYTYAGDANHEASSDSKNFTIGKATSTTTVTITGAPFTYTGSAITPASVTVTGAGGLSLTPDPVYTDNINAGTATASYTYAGDANHEASSDSKNFTIGKATSTTVVTITGAPFIYKGSAITPATVAVTGAGGLNLTPDPVYADNINAGIATASYTYAGDANHEGSSDSKNFTIGKAASTTVVTITGEPFIYNGSAITPASVTVTGVGGLSLTLDPVYADNINAGTATASYTYAGDANHEGSSDSKSFTIGKAASTTTVTITGAPFTYTGSAITPATVTVTGAGGLSLTPDPVYADNINAGTATASYTYAGDANHEGSSDSKSFTIGKAASTTTVTITGAPFTYTGSAITPATVSVTGAGGLNVTPAADYANNINAGTATASYTYAGDANHEGSSDSKNFTIGKASSTTVVVITGASFTYTGSAITPATVTVTGAGGLSMTPDPVYADNINAGTATASYTYAGDANHEGSSGSKNFTIGKATSTTTVTITGEPFIYNGSEIKPATVTVTGAGGLSMTPDPVYADNINAGTATASYTYAGDANHEGSSDSKNFTIGKATSTTVVAITGAPFTYTGSAITPATVTVTGAGGLSLTPDPVYADNINAGTATASYTYAGDANHEGSSDSKNFTIGKAASTTTVTITGEPFIYNGSEIKPASVTVTGAGGLSMTPDPVYADNINAGIATASYTYAGDANHEGSSDSKNFTIGKANAVITVTPYSVTYDGNAHTSAFTAVGVESPMPVDLTGLMTVSATTHTNAGTYTGDVWNFAGNGNYNATSGTVNNVIGKANAVITVTPYSVTYDGNAHTSAFTAVGVESPMPVDLTGLMTVSATTHTNAGMYNGDIWSFAGNGNYNSANGSVNNEISKAASTTTVIVTDATYDGNSHGGIANVTGAGGLNQSLVITYTGIAPTVYAASTTPPVLAGIYNASASYAGDANHTGSSDNKNYTIKQASTTTTLTLSAASVRYMDNLTFTAVIVPYNKATPLTGTVEFKVGSVNYGMAAVVPIPDANDGSVQAMLIKQVAELPANYPVTAIFTPTNLNYSGSTDTKPLQVIARTASPYNATGFYAGDGFAWTTGPNTSSATLTMTAVIKDANSPTGDVRGAKVSFYFVNGSTYTAIPSAQNLPVGLIDVTDGSVGAASAIVQLNIGSANAASFQIAVKITGAYTNNPGDALSQSIVTVSKPVAGGYITGGSSMLNSTSSGYISGAKGLNTDYEFDIQYTKSGTNPKGKVTIMVRSYYTKEGILDSKLHTYLITTNAIALLNVDTPTATGTFSAKANLVEQLSDLSTVAIEGGATFQMVASQNACDQKIAITLYRKAGGIWFSSNWDKTNSKTLLQPVNPGSHVYVSGGGTCSTLTASTAKASTIDIQQESVPVPEANLNVFPNPFSNRLYFNLQAPEDTHALLEMFDLTGRRLATVFDQQVTANQRYDFNFTPAGDVAPGMLIYRLTVGQKIYMGKVIYQPR